MEEFSGGQRILCFIPFKTGLIIMGWYCTVSGFVGICTTLIVFFSLRGVLKIEWSHLKTKPKITSLGTNLLPTDYYGILIMTLIYHVLIVAFSEILLVALYSHRTNLMRINLILALPIILLYAINSLSKIIIKCIDAVPVSSIIIPIIYDLLATVCVVAVCIRIHKSFRHQTKAEKIRISEAKEEERKAMETSEKLTK